MANLLRMLQAQNAQPTETTQSVHPGQGGR